MVDATGLEYQQPRTEIESSNLSHSTIYGWLMDTLLCNTSRPGGGRVFLAGDCNGRFDHVIKAARVYLPAAIVFLGDMEAPSRYTRSSRSWPRSWRPPRSGGSPATTTPIARRATITSRARPWPATTCTAGWFRSPEYGSPDSAGCFASRSGRRPKILSTSPPRISSTVAGTVTARAVGYHSSFAAPSFPTWTIGC